VILIGSLFFLFENMINFLFITLTCSAEVLLDGSI